MATASDNLNRIETPIAAPWTTGQGGFENLELQGSSARMQVFNAFCGATYGSLAASSTMSSEIDPIFITGIGVSGRAGAGTMMSATEGDGYVAFANENTQQISLLRLDDVSGTITPVTLWIVSWTVHALSGHLLKLTSVAGRHRVHYDGVQVNADALDSTYPSGLAGMVIHIPATNPSQALITNWAGDNAATLSNFHDMLGQAVL